VNGIEAWLETPTGRFAISAQRYTPDVVFPDGQQRLIEFRPEPWPRWTFRAEDSTTVSQEIIARHGHPETALRWSLVSGAPGVKLVVRPLMSGRDYHALHHENPAFGFEPLRESARTTWRTYPGLPAVVVTSNGDYRHEPVWYRSFLYEAERERGLDFVEDLASPGSFVFDLTSSGAVMVLSAGEPEALDTDPLRYASELFGREEKRRARFGSPIERAADAYVVRRGSGKTIVAGYPWFTDWGRDAFIALRGFMTAPGGQGLARDILLAWADAVSDGMLPNRFPDSGEELEFNAVDASLWYVVAVHEFLSTAPGAKARDTLLAAVEKILNGYAPAPATASAWTRTA
jgi:predicted glycogen debranching enzyme